MLYLESSTMLETLPRVRYILDGLVHDIYSCKSTATVLPSFQCFATS
jgi:hypothetical protein